MKADDKRIMAEAAGWVNWASRTATNTEEAQAFERWMGQDEAHRDAFAELAALWRSDALGEAAAGVAAARSRRRRLFVWPVIAPAGVALAAAIAAFVFTPWLDHRSFETGRAETRTIRLADGSTVRMNGGARLTVRQGLVGRLATLERGEAFFDIRHDGRRFEVATGEGRVRVMGTAFNVDRLASGRTEVSLYRGAVRVRARGKSVLDLRPGERAVLERGGVQRIAEIDAAQPDWFDGWFDAQDAALGQLVEEMDRFSPKPIVIHGSARRMRISGRFHVAEPRAVLELISVAYGVEVQEMPDRILISGHNRQ